MRIRDTIAKGKKIAAGVTRTKIVNLLENFKVDILSALNNQLETLKNKRRQEEENYLDIFCSKCRKKHPLKDCPLNNI